MICSKCHKETFDGTNFCPFCGEKFSQPEPIKWNCYCCGNVNDSAANFCSKCGKRKGEKPVKNNTQNNTQSSGSSFWAWLFSPVVIYGIIRIIQALRK